MPSFLARTRPLRPGASGEYLVPPSAPLFRGALRCPWGLGVTNAFGQPLEVGRSPNVCQGVTAGPPEKPSGKGSKGGAPRRRHWPQDRCALPDEGQITRPEASLTPPGRPPRVGEHLERLPWAYPGDKALGAVGRCHEGYVGLPRGPDDPTWTRQPPDRCGAVGVPLRPAVQGSLEAEHGVKAQGQ